MSPTQSTIQSAKSLSDRVQQREVLVDACSQCVAQCLDVIQLLSVSTYQQSAPAGASIGTHMRHIIERITCALSGLAVGSINYDVRPRDTNLETSPHTAASALRAIQDKLDELRPDADNRVRIVETVHQDSPSVVVASTLDRELMSLVSHTVHHLAIIGLLARAAGQPLPAELGKAPSTIRYERSLP